MEEELVAAKSRPSRKITGQTAEFLRENDLRGGKMSATQAMVICTLAKYQVSMTPKTIVAKLKGRLVVPATGLDAKLRPAYQSLQLMGLISFDRDTDKPGLHYELTELGSEIMAPIMLDMESEDPSTCFMKADAVKSWYTQEEIDAGPDKPKNGEDNGGGEAETE